MSEERLEELREILHNPNLKGYLANVCNELLQELRKTKNIIKEVREKIKEFCWDYEYETYSNMTSDEVKELAKILDKENK